MRSIILVLTGVVGAVAFFLACGDKNHMDAGADAATCSCPAAEAPLAGRIVQLHQVFTYDQNGGAAVAECKVGTTTGILLGGKCATEDASSSRLKTVGYYYPDFGVSDPTPPNPNALSAQAQRSFACQVGPSTGTVIDTTQHYVVATAICLFPANTPGLDAGP